LSKEILFLLHYYNLFPPIVLYGSKEPWNQIQVSGEQLEVSLKPHSVS